MWVFFVFLFLVFILALLSSMRRRQIYRLFKDGNVIVTGLRGRGKDLLFSSITSARIKDKRLKKKKANFYISNIDYTNGKNRIEFEPQVFNMKGNTFSNFVENKFNYFEYPYNDGIDFFLSDGGVYYPSQYYSQLDKMYPSAPLFFALSRHLGNCNVHVNIQNLNRLWDKMREQADIYILCDSCKVLFRKIAIQKLYIYDNYESAVARRKPFPTFLFMGKDSRIRKADFVARYGMIKKITYIHTIKHKYNDRVFKTMLLNGSKSI